jgi:transposase
VVDGDERAVARPLVPSARDHRQGPSAAADWAAVHRELRRTGVTLQLLWEEHRAAYPDGYGFSRYCELYRA